MCTTLRHVLPTCVPRDKHFTTWRRIIVLPPQLNTHAPFQYRANLVPILARKRPAPSTRMLSADTVDETVASIGHPSCRRPCPSWIVLHSYRHGLLRLAADHTHGSG